MKAIILFSLMIMQLAHAHTSEADFICTYKNIKPAQKWIDEQNNSYDKFKHCAVSCYLALRCSSTEVKAVGVLKEIRDGFGYGTPDMEDIKADFYGVNLAAKKVARDDEDCSRICDENFRP